MTRWAVRIGKKKILTIISGCLLVIFGFQLGYYLRGTEVREEEPGAPIFFDTRETDLNLRQFWYVYALIRRYYIQADKLDKKKLAYGAVTGLVDGIGDEYSKFYDPEEAAQYMERSGGEYAGVGVNLTKKDGLITVTRVFRKTPAEKAGILPGDVITKVNDTDLSEETTPEEAGKLICDGPENSTVRITFMRSSAGKVFEVTLTRARIEPENFNWKLLPDKTAYLALGQFTESIDVEFERITHEMQAAGVHRIILDLRSNRGGSVASAIWFAGWFLKGNSTVTILQPRDLAKRQIIRCPRNGKFRKLPMVILANKYTASASEILISALRYYRQIPVVGENTYGKGCAQSLIRLEDGSYLKLTTDLWLTPDGTGIPETGIEPDVKVPIDTKTYLSGSIVIGEPGKDPQLDQAVKLLQAPAGK